MSKLFPNATMRTHTPYRFDVVDSPPRPDSLKQAHRRRAYDEYGLEEIHRVEDREVVTLIAKEKAVDLPNVTDGEFRHTRWHLDLLFKLLGVELAEAEGYSTKFQAHMHRPVTLKTTGKAELPNVHPFLAHFKALQEGADGHPVKFAIPPPSVLYLITYVRTPNPQLIERYVGCNGLLLADITVVYVKAVNALHDAGCCILQLNDTSWGEFCLEEKRAPYQAQGVGVDTTAHNHVKMLNDIRAAAPADMVLTMHVRYGNFRSTWFSNDDYEPTAEILFGGCNADGFFLEYDSDRADSFKPLHFIKNQQVVLGLVTSKSGELEDHGAVIGRIKEATQRVDINQLYFSPQCDSASTEEGSVLTEEEQWKKLALIRSIVEEVQGNA